jgi:hypothetical protein
LQETRQKQANHALPFMLPKRRTSAVHQFMRELYRQVEADTRHRQTIHHPIQAAPAQAHGDEEKGIVIYLPDNGRDK